MKLKLLTVAAGIALLATSITATAQKVLKEGVATYTIVSPLGTNDTKTFFRGDTSATVTQQGPATIKVISAGAGDYLAVLVDVPVASMKKAAVASPAEMEQYQSMLPEFTFTPGTETKQISGFNCKRITVKDSKSGSTYDAWITTDITLPANNISQLYAKAGGTPVQFQTYIQGQLITATLKGVSEDKAAPSFFKIPSGYDKISMTDLQAMGGKQ